MKHRYAIAGALALGTLIAFLLVGRVRAGDPAWTPEPGDTWQYQLQGRIDLAIDAAVFDIDAFTTRAATVRALHERGRRVVCYVDAGSWEPDRPDAGRFAEEVLGRPVAGWPDERWLDVRRLDILRPILRERLDRCAAKGFDGVELDWIDGYRHATGFDLTRADQLRYDRFLAAAAHRRGLAVGLKNGPGLVPDLVGTFDFAVTEECFRYHECGRYARFGEAGKAVLDVEYDLPRSSFCEPAAAAGISAIRKHVRLDAWRRAC